MSVEILPKAADMDVAKGSIGLQNLDYHQYQLDRSIMDINGGSGSPRRSSTSGSIPSAFPEKIVMMNGSHPLIMDGGKRVECRRSLFQGSRTLSSSYLSLEGVFLLVCLTASLLLLPLMLPPLPPPPFMLLLLPICILVLLVIFACMPCSNARDVSYTNL